MFRPIHIFDLQATATSPSYGYVIEFAHAYFDKKSSNWKITNHFIKLPRDEVLPRRIQKITGISEEDLKLGWSQGELKSYLKNLVESQPNALFVTHYAQFEKAFISNLLTKKLASSMEWICTHKLSKLIYPFLPTHSLRAVAGHVGFSLGALKRSQGQLDANVHLWKSLRLELKNQFSINSFEELEEWIPQRKKDIKIIYQNKGPNKKYLKISDQERLSLPNSPGVYRFYSSDGRLLYIGKAKSLKSRVNSYFTGNPKKLGRKAELIIQVARIEYDSMDCPIEAALFEVIKIKTFDPPYNQALTPKNHDFIYLIDRNLETDPVEDLEQLKSPKVFWNSYLVTMRDSVFESLDYLLEFLQGGPLSEDILFGFAEEKVLAKAVNLLLLDYPHLRNAKSKRDILAWCYRVFLDTHTFGDDDEELLVDDEELLEDIEETDFENPEDVKLSLYNVCAHLVRAHLKIKLLSSIFNSHIRYKDGSSEVSEIEIENGRLNKISCSDLDTWQEWRTLSLADSYEILRVLITETFRIHRTDDANHWVEVRVKGFKGEYKKINFEFWTKYL